jgi:lipoyl(octanoyl) transferase
MTVHSTDHEPSLRREDGAAVGWAISRGLTDYAMAVAAMERRAEAIAGGSRGELIWLLEHPPMYSAGVSANAAELLDPGRFPVFTSARGGRYTYHGPGQRVAYVMLDLKARRRDARVFVEQLQAWLIDAIAPLGVRGVTREGQVGVWVASDGANTAEDRKIAAVGVKLRRWVSFHGVSLNVRPNLEHFAGIVPCGLPELGVTSLAELGYAGSMTQVDRMLRMSFEARFSPTIAERDPLSTKD